MENLETVPYKIECPRYQRNLDWDQGDNIEDWEVILLFNKSTRIGRYLPMQNRTPSHNNKWRGRDWHSQNKSVARGNLSWVLHCPSVDLVNKPFISHLPYLSISAGVGSKDLVEVTNSSRVLQNISVNFVATEQFLATCNKFLTNLLENLAKIISIILLLNCL